MNIQNINYFFLSVLFFSVPKAVAMDLDRHNLTDKVTLRNGSSASQIRIDEVWQALQQIDTGEIHGENFWLWRTCLECRKLNDSACAVGQLDHEKLFLQPFTESSIAKFDALKITSNGMLDEETQNIILSSRSGTIDGKFVSKHYPIKN